MGLLALAPALLEAPPWHPQLGMGLCTDRAGLRCTTLPPQTLENVAALQNMVFYSGKVMVYYLKS